MKKRIAALITAALLSVCMMPLSSLADGTRYPTPDGYNENDYQKLVTFLELVDENGARNGEKLSESYDPLDPATWEGTTWENGRIKEIDFERYAYNEKCVGKLDVSDCTMLEWLYCGGNQLTSLDVSNNTALEVLDCISNQLTSLDVSSNTSLGELYCGGNQLTSLDVSSNTSLGGLDCGSNQLEALNVSNCTALTYLSCASNQLTELDVSNCTALKDLYCYSNQLTTLDVSNNRALEELDCYYNQLTSLNVSGCTALAYLDCGSNQLEALNVSGCTALTELYCGDNQLTELDVSNNTALVWLDCRNNQLTSLNLEANNSIAVDRVGTVGDGFIGANLNYVLSEPFNCVYAEPKSGSTFVGWYDENNVLLSDEATFDISDIESKVFIAKFEEGSTEPTPTPEQPTPTPEQPTPTPEQPTPTPEQPTPTPEQPTPTPEQPTPTPEQPTPTPEQPTPTPEQPTPTPEQPTPTPEQPTPTPTPEQPTPTPTPEQPTDGVSVDFNHNGGTVEYTYDEENYLLTLYITPKAGYYAKSISVNGSVVAENPTNPYVLDLRPYMKKSEVDAEIFVEFALIPGVRRVTVSSSSCGTVDVNMPDGSYTVDTDGSYLVNAGTELTLTMKPDANHYVWYVAVNGSVTAVRPGNAIKFTVETDMDITVVFRTDAAETTPAPTNPTKPPKTGAISATAIAVTAVLGGAAMLIKRKK
ncbi:MAG: leucine-rich repeat domain-containing protein [Christensenellales bacterium]